MDKRQGKRVKSTRTKVRSSVNKLDDLFAKFIAIKKAEGRADSTIRQYEDNYGFFIEYLDRHKIKRSMTEIDREIIREYVVYMREKWTRFDGHKYKKESEMTVGLLPSSINTRLKTLRVMFNCLEEEQLIVHNPMEGVKNVREPEEEIVILNSEELKRLIATPNQREYSAFRDYVLMHLLIDSMCRISEALGLRRADVDFTNKSVTIPATIAKSRKARTLPLQPITLRLLKELINENIADFDSNYIFLANYGEQLTRDHFRKRLNKYAEQAGIEKNVHPHLFRHTSATMFLEAGGDIRHLQLLLGHNDLRMVMRYTHLSRQSLHDQHGKYSAMNTISGKLNKPRKRKR
ncbi:tyrosine-type recombinase/integrase [Cytobacillus gottheilii]|uniref:Tyrosine-type recombinase/integrase n=1 Tax=Cytobacillus gottheilii TaxID=859144 RepID=A0ABX8FFX8_9BACI|nr:tyrosine-type recombinase/integrase [Cytobacillus gottheilii]QVY62933.1 tyrosine-type recombinase/integrase [Cytobacillus gottheilii]